MKTKELLSPLNDLVFKALFAREEKECKIILIDFLNELLKLEDENKIVDIEYMNPFNYEESYGDKLSILDIKIKTEKDERINVEVQVRNDDNFRKRSLYYWSKMYSETISKAETYDQLKKSIVINILKTRFIDETEKYHTIYKILEKEEKFLLVDDLEIHYIELEKFDNTKGIEQLEGVELWLEFFKEIGSEGSQERLNKLIERSEKIKMAIEILKKISSDEKILEEYSAREKAKLDEMSRLKYAEIKGEKKGEKKGEEKEKIAVAKEMLAYGEPMEKIIRYSKLTEEEINKLKKEISN